MEKIGIIGNGVAAVTAIREIRKKDERCEIEVFTDERHYYYPRPKLIDYVAGKIEYDDVIQYGKDWYDSHNAELHLSEAVVEINPDTDSILTQKQTHFGFTKILIASGCYPFVPPIHGVEKKGVHVLRTLDDAMDIRKEVAGLGREIVIGGGILGIELAASMKSIGGDPVVVSNIGTLLPQQLDQQASNVLLDRLNDMGITVYLGFTCSQVSGGENATGIVSSKGAKLRGDLVVLATGVRPNITLAKEAGLSIDRGILVDEYMQTSTPNVFAAGDCVIWNDEWYGIIPVALETAKIAGQNTVEFGSAKYGGTTPSNTLQVAGIDLTSVGIFNPTSAEYETILSTDSEKGNYYKAVLKDNIVVGGISLGSRKFALKLRRLIRSKQDVSDEKKSLFDDV